MQVISKVPFLVSEKKVLIIDHDPNIYSFLCYLESYNSGGFVAETCMEMLSVLKTSTVDVILFNAASEYINVFETVYYLSNKSEHKNIPIVVMADNYNEDDRKKYLLAGAADYIYKSGELDFILLKVNQILHDPKKNKQEANIMLELFVAGEENDNIVKKVNDIIREISSHQITIKVIDIYKNKRLALRRKITVTPTLVKVAPNLSRLVISSKTSANRIVEKIKE